MGDVMGDVVDEVDLRIPRPRGYFRDPRWDTPALILELHCVVHAPSRNRLHVPGAVRHAGGGMLTAALSARGLLPLRYQGFAVVVGDAIRVIPLRQQRPALLRQQRPALQRPALVRDWRS